MTTMKGECIAPKPFKASRPGSGLARFLVLAALILIGPSTNAQTYSLVHSFSYGGRDGVFPAGELVFDKAGNVYGAAGGNPVGAGILFKLDSSGKETILHDFAGGLGDGSQPTGRLVRYAGNLYGTTAEGGAAACSSGCGTVFEWSNATETVVASFSGANGSLPRSGLVRDASGNFYGTTFNGGDTPPGCNCGTVFEISGGTETLLHSFGGEPGDGRHPFGGLVIDHSGNIFGTTTAGGKFGQGAVFELVKNSDASWSEVVLYSFRGASDGGSPYGGLVIDAKGNLYGTTDVGGISTHPGGVVFKLHRNLDGSWSERVLHRFSGPPLDGQEPVGDLIRDTKGNLYGVTNAGGKAGLGIIFGVASDGQETVLHDFVGPPWDGASPRSGLAGDPFGNIYGMTLNGGNGTGCDGGCGTVFKLAP